MRQVNLFFLTDVKYGGFATYTAHLAKAFEEQGWFPLIIRITKRTESRSRLWAHGLWSINMNIKDAVVSAMSNPSIITCAYWKKKPEAIERLLNVGAGLVLHDPTEYHPELISLAKRLGTSVISIRKANNETLKRMGVRSTFIPHPYVMTNRDLDRRVRHNAVAISRVDWDKRTDIIAEANSLLPPNSRCAIYGAANRLYAHHNLEKTWPNWSRDYFGLFPHGWDEAAKIAARANWVVDMSVIKGDGGGTQYTFLEAWEVGVPLVINKAWVREDDDTMSPGFNCYAVENAEELSGLLQSKGAGTREQVIKGGRETLANHASELTIKRFKKFLGF